MKKLLVLIVLLALALPLTASAAATVTYTSGFQLQNLSSSTANVTIDFYDQTGVIVKSVSDTINANASKTYYPLSAVQVGFDGSAVVSSDQQIAAITNVLGNDGQRGASYSGFSSGAKTVKLPLVMKGWYGIDTWFNVQNTGSTDASVTVAYKPGSCTENATIKAGAAATFKQSANTCLPAAGPGLGFVGAASVTSNQPVVAVVMQVDATSLLAYNGFNSTSLLPVFPQVSSNYYKSGTGIQVQNSGGSSTNVTLSYVPSAGFPGHPCTETKTVPAGQSITFGYPQLPAACGGTGTGVTDTVNHGFVGSARVTINSASQPLAAIVNIVTRGAAAADAYDAVDPGAATNRVSMPIIMDRNYGLFTGFAVTNVGSAATTISCTFANNAHTESATVQPGESLTAVQLNKLGAGYVGGAICTASAGAKIAGIVNQAKLNSAASDDLFLMYSAIGY
jgi:hypothetical protein